jgi:PII-like signaling protein
MKIEAEAILLRIHIGEDDKVDGKLLYKRIIEILIENNIAGATVLRGIMGYGASTRIHTISILDISSDLPIVIEVVDEEEKIESVLPKIEPLIKDGLITKEKVKIIKYTASKKW